MITIACSYGLLNFSANTNVVYFLLSSKLPNLVHFAMPQAKVVRGREHPRSRAAGGARRRQVLPQAGRRKRWEGTE